MTRVRVWVTVRAKLDAVMDACDEANPAIAYRLAKEARALCDGPEGGQDE